MEILLSVVYTFIFLLIIRRSAFYKPDGLHTRAVPILFLVKLMAGISLGLIYTYYYTNRETSDTFRLFDDSLIVFDLLKTAPADFLRIMTGIGGDAPHLEIIYNRMHNWYDIYSPINDNRSMIRLNTLLRFFSFGHYYVHVVFISFLSATGTIALIRFVSSVLPGCTKLLFVMFGFLPSVLFWGSGLMKDAVVIFSLGFTLYYFGKYVSEKAKTKHLLLFLISLLLLMFTRFQILVITLPGLAAWYISINWKKNPALVFPTVMLIFLVMAALLPGLIPSADLPDLLYRKQQSFLKLANETDAGSLIGIIPFQPEFGSALLYAPVGFLNALIRPFVTDALNPLLALGAIENSLILIFGIYCILNSRNSRPLNQPLFLFAAFFVLVSFSLIGLVTPVLGAIVRYKTPGLPFLMVVFVMLLNQEKRKQLNLLAGRLLI